MCLSTYLFIHFLSYTLLYSFPPFYFLLNPLLIYLSFIYPHISFLFILFLYFPYSFFNTFNFLSPLFSFLYCLLLLFCSHYLFMHFFLVLLLFSHFLDLYHYFTSPSSPTSHTAIHILTHPQPGIQSSTQASIHPFTHLPIYPLIHSRYQTVNHLVSKLRRHTSTHSPSQPSS